MPCHASFFVLLASCLLAARSPAQLPTEPTWIQHPPIGGMRPEAMFADGNQALWVLGGYSPLLRSWRFHQGVWSELRPAVSPPQRLGAGLAYDRQRNVAVLFGGYGLGSSTTLGDLWEFDGVTWTQRAFGGAWPVSRARPAFAYDPVRQRCVLFSGWRWPTPTNDTWEYDGVGWTQGLPANPPSPRDSAGFTFDGGLGKLVLAGGGSGGSALLAFETWTYDGTWSQLQPPVSPPTRQSPLLAHDPLRSRTVLFGGATSPSSPPAFSDTWEFDGATWQPVPTMNVPFGAYSGVAAWSPAFGAVTHFGGMPGVVVQPSAALTTFDGSDWLPQTTQQLFHRHRPWLAFDSARDRLVLHGGFDPSGTARRDTFEWRNGSWQPTATNTGPTTPMVYDAARRCIVAVDAGITWEYDANGWTPRVLSPVPAPGGPIWFDRFAGVVRTAVGQGLWTFDGATWTVSPTVGPAPACSACAAAFHTTDGTVSVSGMVTGAYPPLPWRWNGATWSPTTLAPGVTWNDVPMSFDPVRGVASAIDLFGREMFTNGGPWTMRSPPPFAELPYQCTADTLTGRLFAVAGDGSVWEQTWPGVPSFAPYGRGCAASAGTPRLQPVGPTIPQLGQALPFELRQLPPAAGLVVLAYGNSIAEAGGTPLPLPLAAIGLPGCSAWLAPLATMATVHSGNQHRFVLNLPASPALAGALLGFQALVFDGAAANSIGAVSNALLAVAW